MKFYRTFKLLIPNTRKVLNIYLITEQYYRQNNDKLNVIIIKKPGRFYHY